jgi:hypothetical protein
MSTPQGNLGIPTGATPANSNLYNQVSSSGMAGREMQMPAESQEQPKMESLVEKATQEFGAVFNTFVKLTESYPGADKEAEAVKNAMANWHLRIANSINESGQNSTY